ncbi:tRNA(fMet)-specific endonuclease VapC [uncultured archaeon]|nr:tRNA(fMet)-specific endonuclease VapC [uncultured archaeon]
MYLVDTNVWLELLLEQEKEADVRQFFQSTEANSLSITDFSLYSIGIILIKLKQEDVLVDFISDTIEDSGVMRISLDTSDLKKIVTIRQRYNLDFDDCYQYIAAEKYNYSIISFDSHFDRTERGRKTPNEILLGD